MTRTRKRLFTAAGILIAAAALIITLLPYGIEYGIVKALNEQGAEEASVENVDLNPFTGRLVVQGLAVSESGKGPLDITELALQISWRSLFKKRIFLEELTLLESRLFIEQTGEGVWKIGGLEIPGETEKPEDRSAEETTEEETAPWGIGIEHLAIRSSWIKFKGMGLDTELDISALDISNVKSWEPGLAAKINLTGGLNKSGLNIKTSVLPFSPSPSVKGTFSIDKLALAPFNALVAKDGTFSIENGNLSSEGSFEYAAGTEKDTVRFSGGVTVKELSLSDRDGIRLLEVKKLELRGIEVESLEKINVAAVELEKIEAVKPQQDKDSTAPLLQSDSLLVSGIAAAGLNDISIDSIVMRGLEPFILRRPDGTWYLIDKMTGDGKEKTPGKESDENADEKTGPVRVRIADIVLLDNRIRFEDENIEPPYRTELRLDTIEAHNIDTGDPDSKSPWSIEGGIGDYSSIKLSGDIKPFAERLTMEMTGKIEQLDLHPISPYTLKALGYNIKSGHMNSEIDLKISSGDIKSENALVLKKLEISPENETKMEALVSELGLSLESALSLLRDGDGTIRLTLPVEGDIDNPDIKLSDIINKALGKAMKKAAFGYLKHAIQPYGTLITIIQFAGEKAARIKLDPVEFRAGSDTLDTDGRKYMKVVAELLKERPELEVSICGKVTTADINVLTEQALQALREERAREKTGEEKKAAAEGQEEEQLAVELSDEELLEFARARSANIKTFLAEEHGIDPGRLFICNPGISREEDATPAAELLI